MNLRNVLRAYSLLRQLSDDESALLNILRALNDSDREQLVASMSDKPQKKSSKKAAGGGGKSKRAASLGEKVGGTLASIAKTVGGNDDNARKIIDAMDRDDGSSGRCQAKRSDDRVCMLLPDHNIHHLTTAREYHEFQSLPSPRCAFRVTDIERCSATEGDPIHDAAANPETYHEFQPPASSAAGSGG